MNTKYTKEYFIAKFEAIPEDKWIVGKFYDPDNIEICCADGHCGAIDVWDKVRIPEVSALENLLNREATCINDNLEEKYTHLGSTPKERILNALKAL